MTPPSPLARSLAPVVGILWPLYLTVSLLTGLVWITGFGEGVLADSAFKHALPSSDLRSALALFSRALDSAWTALGAIMLYLAIVRSEGLDVARRWFGMTVIVGFAVSMASALTSWPLGPVFYPQNLGWKIGPVPFALPLLWAVIVIGSREVALRLFTRAGHGIIALASGALALVTIVNLDPLAWKYRAWWLWYPLPNTGANHAPWQNFITWAIAAVGLAWFMRSPHVAPKTPVRPRTPLVVWCVLNGICLLTHLALKLR